MSKVVFITGCSTGIGRELACRLGRSGYIVVATARNIKTLGNLPAALTLPLDVTQPDSVRDAVARTLKEFGRIDVLVNNAGYTMQGALEEVSDQQTQQVFDVNVFGALRMMRAIAPQMRKARSGCIINISSISGKLSTPANGTYSATKFALEALSDAMRWELASFGIRVVVVEPGAIKTQFDGTARAQAGTILSNPASPYRPLYEASQQFAAGMRQSEPGPEVVSQVIQRVMETPRPKDRYLVAISLPGRLMIHLRDLFWNPAVCQMFKVRESPVSGESFPSRVRQIL